MGLSFPGFGETVKPTSPAGPCISLLLSFGRLGASVFAPWGTISAPREHTSGLPWRTKEAAGWTRSGLEQDAH